METLIIVQFWGQYFKTIKARVRMIISLLWIVYMSCFFGSWARWECHGAIESWWGFIFMSPRCSGCCLLLTPADMNIEGHVFNYLNRLTQLVWVWEWETGCTEKVFFRGLDSLVNWALCLCEAIAILCGAIFMPQGSRCCCVFGCECFERPGRWNPFCYPCC